MRFLYIHLYKNMLINKPFMFSLIQVIKQYHLISNFRVLYNNGFYIYFCIINVLYLLKLCCIIFQIYYKLFETIMPFPLLVF